MINQLNFAPFLVSFKLSIITTIVLFIIGMPLSWWLSRTKKSFLKSLVEAFVALPLVLPPTVLGFYLLLVLGESGFIGSIWHFSTGYSLAFTFTGLVIGSTLYSLPFVVQPLQNSFESIGNFPLEIASTLGASKLNYFFSVHIFLAQRGILTAGVLGFAHTLGEFGVVLMIGGNIPDKTQVISIAIYDLVEQLEYAEAHVLSLITLLISFLILFTLFITNTNYKRVN